MGGKKKYIEMFGSFTEPFKYFYLHFVVSDDDDARFGNPPTKITRSL